MVSGTMGGGEETGAGELDRKSGKLMEENDLSKRALFLSWRYFLGLSQI